MYQCQVSWFWYYIYIYISMSHASGGSRVKGTQNSFVIFLQLPMSLGMTISHLKYSLKSLNMPFFI